MKNVNKVKFEHVEVPELDEATRSVLPAVVPGETSPTWCAEFGCGYIINSVPRKAASFHTNIPPSSGAWAIEQPKPRICFFGPSQKLFKFFPDS